MLTLTITLVVCGAAQASAPKLTTLIAERQVATWKCQDQLGWQRTPASVEPWALPKSDKYRRWVLNVWKMRAGVCAAALAEVKRQWNWQAFLTPVERAVLMCETQMNWHHNSGTYQGAPGFYHGSWDAFKPEGYPDEAYEATPWQQTVVMRRIRARYGWSGWGCYTHGGYRSHL